MDAADKSRALFYVVHSGQIGFAVGLGVLVLAWILMWAATGARNIFHVALGADNRISTSKLQFCVWTVVIVFAYVAIYATKACLNDFSPLTGFPQNLILAMGLSGGTAVGAKLVTVGQINSGSIAKTTNSNSQGANQNILPANQNAQVAPAVVAPAAAVVPGVLPTPAKPDYRLGAAFTDDQGNLDLAKIQVLSWTVVSIGVFLSAVFLKIFVNTKVSDMTLPDIGETLLALMGIGSAAYIGTKASSGTTVRITGITPSSTTPGQPVTLTGQGFGEKSAGNSVLFDGQPISNVGLTWSDKQIVFTVPDSPPTTAAWSASGEKTEVAVMVQGVCSSNSVSLVVTGPAV